MGKHKILVVDDDHECRLLLSTLVARAGFDVDAVADGEMALAMVKSRAPDLVLLDAYLPRLDGFSVCRAIKDSPASTRTPVIMLTAFTSPEAREKGLSAGADEFVEKPYRGEALLDVIRQLLAIREAAKQLDMGEQAVAEGLRSVSSRR